MDPHHISPDYERLAGALREFILRSQRVLDRVMAAHGASFAQGKMLQAILEREVTRSTDLAALHGLSPRTVTEAIDGLERAGLVERVPAPSDRRAKNLSLTAAGETVARATQEVRQTYLSSLFSALSEAECAEFERLLNTLSERLSSI